MSKKALLGLVILTMLGLGGTGLAEQPYTWVQVVERGMPDFNNREVAQEAFMEDTPLSLSFPSGIDVMFSFVKHEGQTYAVYHERKTSDVVGIARLDSDSFWPQGLHFYEFYVDSGLLKGDALTGEFLHITGSNRIFAGLCRIADLSNEARPHVDCPKSARTLFEPRHSR